ncbi:hypothetical protein [Nostoc sp.]
MSEILPWFVKIFIYVDGSFQKIYGNNNQSDRGTLSSINLILSGYKTQNV